MPATPVVSPSTSFREEKKEFDEEQLKIEREFELIQNARVDLYENEMKLKKRVAQQLKSLSSLEKQVKSSSSSCVPANHNNNTPTATKTETATAASTNEETTIITELKHSKDSLQKYNTEILNPGSKFLQMFLGSVNSVVLNGHASRRYKFKQEYEDFKRKCTLWNIPVAFLLLILFQSRAIDTIYQIWLAYFYLTLAMRESILQVNGSRINKWWINHHYLSVLLVTTLITWPKTMIYQQFRSQFFIYSFYSSIVQLLQYQYQTQRLYVMKTLGKANQMDVANSDSTQVVFSRQFIFLLPFVFIGQLMQFYNAICLLFWCWRANEWQEWQAYLVAAEFFVLAYGNFVTTVRIFKKKYRKYQNQKSE